MAGELRRILPVTLFDWSSMGASQSNSICAVDYIDVSGWKEGQLVVRAHTGTNIGSGATLNVNLISMDPAEDDPATLFTEPPSLAPNGLLSNVIVFSSTTNAPYMQMTSLIANFGTMARLVLVMNQPAGSPVSAKLVLSVDLILKTDD